MKNQLLLIFLFLLNASGSSSAERVTSPPGTFNFIKNAKLPKDFDIQGHRGARGLKAENTLPGFEVALDLGVSTLEFDLTLHFRSSGGNLA